MNRGAGSALRPTFAEDPGRDDHRCSIRPLPQRRVRQGAVGCRDQADITWLQRGRIPVCIAAVYLKLKQTSTCADGV